MSKTIQIRVTEQEHAFIKNAFQEENLSQMIRDFLLKEAEERVKHRDVSLQTADSSIQAFVAMLSSPEVQQTLYNIFKSKGGKE